MRPLIILSLLWSCYASLYAQAKRTQPQPPDVPDRFLERLHPANMVPQPPDKWRFRVTGKRLGEGRVYHQSEVPLYKFGGSKTWKYKVGAVPVGTEIKLEYIRAVGGRHFYGLVVDKDGNPDFTPRDPAAPPPRLAWLDGVFIEVIK